MIRLILRLSLLKFQIWTKTFAIHVVEREGRPVFEHDDFASAAGDWSSDYVSESEVEVSDEEEEEFFDQDSVNRHDINDDRERWEEVAALENAKEKLMGAPIKVS